MTEIVTEWGFAIYVGVASFTLLCIVIAGSMTSKNLREIYQSEGRSDDVPDIDPGYFCYWIFLASLWPVTIPLMFLYIVATLIWDYIDPLD